ncbi:MAG: alpha/beta hydrolase [Dehalococcoidia bacterium]|nr:alpha/beta hydrolase [Dehalococcoidia bacterium]
MDNFEAIRQNYHPFDIPEILRVVFYPRQDFSPPPSGASDVMVEVEGNISIAVRFYVKSSASPSIVFFHGNGEVAADYNDVAPLYHNIGCNLVVADYRGYGKSGGIPSFASMAVDAHKVFKRITEKLDTPGGDGRVFLMGRSLGSVSALELASSYPDRISGLIIESGFASLPHLLERLGFPPLPGLIDKEFPNRLNATKVNLPALIIHGEWDDLIPISEARDLYLLLGSKNKTVMAIPGAGHNNIMLVGGNEYFAQIKKFVSSASG